MFSDPAAWLAVSLCGMIEPCFYSSSLSTILLQKPSRSCEAEGLYCVRVSAIMCGSSGEFLMLWTGLITLYFDRVSQIRMPKWSQGRIALVGDAAYCVSLVAGQGSALAMTGAYVLAGELAKASGTPVGSLCELRKDLARLHRRQAARR